MKTIVLGKEVEAKKNVQPPVTTPNITEDCIFVDENGKNIGFYIKNVPERLKKIARLANKELMSKNVPKSLMNRVWYENGIRYSLPQYSTIIGAVKPEYTKRRYKPGFSHVHLDKKAETYIKLMYLFAEECEKLIKELTPDLYEEQLELVKSQEIKVGNLWTSSIANCNVAARTHIDGANLKGCGNIIYYKRANSVGGNLHLPGYNAVIDSADDSLVFYPAWKSVHGVEEIITTKSGGYRNSLVLYPLDISYSNTGEGELEQNELKP